MIPTKRVLSSVVADNRRGRGGRNGGKGDDEHSILHNQRGEEVAELVLFDAGQSAQAWAAAINARGVHVLVDLLGWLPVAMAHRAPAV